ncbi:hypothetical protein B0T19DRAFT_95654 [Cercophora scortea]|uniref:Uncharacterized protein n=1 Tax=Cercophora scortea TaxID=314031 RepID=A0AAE0MH88_9PEZI|nr:hypothetical protein B0T19DRAFT_95654 [Cercophora scortea]
MPVAGSHIASINLALIFPVAYGQMVSGSTVWIDWALTGTDVYNGGITALMLNGRLILHQLTFFLFPFQHGAAFYHNDTMICICLFFFFWFFVAWSLSDQCTFTCSQISS